MNQQEFIRQLQDALARLPQQEKQEIIADYQEYFRDGLAAGRSEADIAAGLGDPQQLARELMARHHIARWEDRKTVGNLFAVVGAIAGMGLLNFLLAVPFLFYLWMLTMVALVSACIIIGGIMISGFVVCNEFLGLPGIQVAREVSSSLASYEQTRFIANARIDTPHSERLLVEHDASSGKANISIQSKEGRVDINVNASDARGRLPVKQEDRQLDINRKLDWGLSIQSTLMLGFMLLLVGSIGLLVCYLLARWTWRGLLVYGRYQMGLLDKAKGKDV